MATRTPWSDVHPGTGDTESSYRPLPTPPSGRRPVWGYLCGAGLCATTLVLLFQPWLSAAGPGGTIRSDAFGRLAGTESQQDWGGAGLHNTDISGTWAVLTCVAILATIFAVAAYLRTRATIFSTAAAVAVSGVALFVLADVLYLDNKESEMRAAVADDSSFSGILRGLFGGAHAAHQLAGAHLDIAAMLAGITAFGAATCVLTNHLRENPVTRAVDRTLPTLADAAPSSAPIAPTPHSSVPVMPLSAPAAQPMARAAQPSGSAAQPSGSTAQPSGSTAQPLAGVAQPSAPNTAPPMSIAPPQVPAAPHLITPAAPPAPVVALADITAEHEPAPRNPDTPRFPAGKQPSWRIVIPAGAVSPRTPTRVERTFAG
ncbi:hypothetical protein IRT45_25415 [Nocardia sp. BSTN01]|uniref:hypothetical protein n=1 Tax=Nocardia sp. BSTN01 TaxID=2783665 RepID=UPI00188F3181|nr:hypothetical protein [Nocardia sp. BSTN01]MBF5000486.1 hypothetical protein [Nocardia sp. BSTN01]